jgi:hypothetical protein
VRGAGFPEGRSYVIVSVFGSALAASFSSSPSFSRSCARSSVSLLPVPEELLFEPGYLRS